MIRYTLVYHPDVKKSDLPPIPANLRERIKRTIENRILKDPVKFGLPLRKSLKGYRKTRVGDYRIIYSLKGNTIFILKIGHRREVYAQPSKRFFSRN
jgi:mRNA interferase RelE/StbE